jgi:hypothetical protein
VNLLHSIISSLNSSLSLASIGKKESLIVLPKLFYSDHVMMWADPVAAMAGFTTAQVKETLKAYSDRSYLVLPGENGRHAVVIKQGASSADQLQGYYEAYLCSAFGLQPGSADGNSVSKSFASFISLLSGLGWRCDKLLLREPESKCYKFDDAM